MREVCQPSFLENEWLCNNKLGLREQKTKSCRFRDAEFMELECQLTQEQEDVYNEAVSFWKVWLTLSTSPFKTNVTALLQDTYLTNILKGMPFAKEDENTLHTPPLHANFIYTQLSTSSSVLVLVIFL